MSKKPWTDLSKALETILKDHESGLIVLELSEAEYVASVKRRLESLGESLNVNDN